MTPIATSRAGVLPQEDSNGYTMPAARVAAPGYQPTSWFASVGGARKTQLIQALGGTTLYSLLSKTKSKMVICFNGDFPHSQQIFMHASCTTSKIPHFLPSRNRYSSRFGQAPYDTYAQAEQSTHPVCKWERYFQTKTYTQHRI